MRLLILALVASLAVLVSATAIGRAIDTEAPDRIYLERDGVSLDCERIVGTDGQVGYDGCITVP